MEKIDAFQHYLSLCFPAVFLLGGIACLINALTGSRKFFEEHKNPAFRQSVEQYGKGKMRLVVGLSGLAMTAFGGWLVYCWFANGTAW